MLAVIFTEIPNTILATGGRHVEFGSALAQGKRVIVVGPRRYIRRYQINHRFSYDEEIPTRKSQQRHNTFDRLRERVPLFAAGLSDLCHMEQGICDNKASAHTE
jgi:hypothetical protein